ncbi:hypothetical protein C8F04DRAFT_1310939 [Mycena alexandri]|uniref:AMP-dependent synthetase/ligase domain-containing protein n=1 Tax=Mycena alexandri TaxID=1745969 RepID=A0AAD6T6U5_9AGAR|nr:hypothetical protein C8F04DRAFT_1310939 [Mycena alexandri]
MLITILQRQLAAAHACGSISTTIATPYDTLGPAGPTSPTAPRASPTPSSSPPCSPSSPAPPPSRPTPTPKLLVQLGEAGSDITVLSLDDLRKRGQATKDANDPSLRAARRPAPSPMSCIVGIVIPHANPVTSVDARYTLLGHHRTAYLAYLPRAHLLECIVELCTLVGGMPTGFGAMEFRLSIIVGVPVVWETVRKGIGGKVQAGGATRSSVFKGVVEAKVRGTPGLARLADSVILSGVRAATGGRGAAEDRDERGLLSVALVMLLQGYGITKSCAMCAIMPPDVFRFDFVGLPAPSIEIKLCDVPEAGYFSCGRQGAPEERGAVQFSSFFALLSSSCSCCLPFHLPSFLLCFVLLVFDLGGRPLRPWLGGGPRFWWMIGLAGRCKQGKNGVLGERGPFLHRCAPLVHAECGRDMPCVGAARHLLGRSAPGGRVPWAGSQNEPFSFWLRSAVRSVRCPRRYSRALDARVDPKVAALVLRECNVAGKKATETLTAVVLTPDEWTPESGLVTAAQKIQRSAVAKKFDREIKHQGAAIHSSWTTTAITMKSLALPLTRWWSRSDSSPNSAKAALPMELWYTIIHEITDKDLLRVSSVCSTLNALAISEYLARHDISTVAKEISGPAYIIHPLQLSCIPLPVEHLVCHFRPYDVRRDLLSLQRFVPRAQRLRDLELSFAGSLLHAHRNDRIPIEYSARELMSIFCRVLSGMASKAAGPVVVVGQFAMFMSRAEEIAGWRLDALQFSPLSERNTLMAKIRGISGGPSTTITLRTTVQMSGTQPEPLTREQVLENLRTVNVWVHDAPGVDYTMLVSNISSITLLDLNDSPIPDEQLAAVLRDLTLPYLETLSISRSGIDPTALGGFLARQPRLQHFTSFTRKPSSPLISSPLAHPTLINMKAVGTENICLAMDALHLSPLLETFMFSYTHDTLSSLSNLTPAFRLLSQRSFNAHLELTIHESSPNSNPSSSSSMDEPLFDDEAASTARTLHCVYSVVISCSSADMGLRILPWLVLFLRLLKVKFYLNVTSRDPRPDDPLGEVELKRLMGEVKKKLAHVPSVRKKVWELLKVVGSNRAADVK